MCETQCIDCGLCSVVCKLGFGVLQSNAAIASGQWWRLFTPAFLHANLVHLAVNNFSLHNLGPLLETVSGRPRFAIVYAVAAVGGCVASYYGTTNLSLGASGKPSQCVKNLTGSLLTSQSALRISL